MIRQFFVYPCYFSVRLLSLSIVALLSCLQGYAQGYPLLRNFSAAEYGAHNRNFDIVTADDGTVYVANFEGLLYYDRASWRILHTPNMQRLLSVSKDEHGTIWADGYEFRGKVVVQENGELTLSRTDSHLSHEPSLTAKLAKGLVASVMNGGGVVVSDSLGRKLFQVTEKEGLCSNNVASIAYDGKGILWGATDNGIFAMAIPSPYSYFDANNGLRGEVHTIRMFNNTLYVGTSRGLYRLQDKQFFMIPQIDHACWDLDELNSQLLAATSEGVFSVDADGTVRQRSTALTRSLMVSENSYYTGEQNGVYKNNPAGFRVLVCDVERVEKIIDDAEGTIWLKTIEGRIWKKPIGKMKFVMVDNEEAATLVIDGQRQVRVVGALDEVPFVYPLFSYTDMAGIIWLTDNEGHHLYAWRQGKRLSDYDGLLSPVGLKAVRAMLVDNRQLWLGGDFGLLNVNFGFINPIEHVEPKVMLRSVKLNGDSILWGGYGEQPNMLPVLNSDDRNLTFTYSLPYTSLLGQTRYRYRINEESWSAWSTTTHVQLSYHPRGLHSIDIQALDAMGRMSPITTIDFHIMQPIYLRSYMIGLYIVLLVVLVFMLIRWRSRKLEREKQRLEGVVQKRTAEIMKQKDEIEQKSQSLETALSDLSKAQSQLIRQEKMATVGKLTQGLIDRILNPLNYINNFSKLSEGLVKDVAANIEDEKEHMDAENYEDTVEVLDMLEGNLKKVSEHGQNTTRTLKAMEEMLKDRSGGMAQTDLVALLKQNHEMLMRYYEKELSEHHVQVAFNLPAHPVLVNGNAEQLSKAVMSLLGNAVYALVKKVSRQNYDPQILVCLQSSDQKAIVTIRDNGIGIEPTIIDKIFDPFFTTKTTGEASGVGLYLCREIMQNHGGDIHVASTKDSHTEFTFTIPLVA